VRAGILGIGIVLSAFVSACSGGKSVHLHPPVPLPAGMLAGYGVDRSPQVAHEKALTDLIVRSSDHPSDATFKSKAAEFLKPSHINSGVRKKIAWVLIGSSEAELSDAWTRFDAWRSGQIAEAHAVYDAADAPGRVAALRLATDKLKDAGVEDDPLHAQVELENRFRVLFDDGQLREAERATEGMDPYLADACRMEVIHRRKQAIAEMVAGDEYLRAEQYKEALGRYREAGRLDRDNAQLPGKIALAEDQRNATRMGAIRLAAGVITWSARIFEEYQNQKQEEARRRSRKNPRG
jgi:tetratricopeptide (TPR) repeat protein